MTTSPAGEGWREELRKRFWDASTENLHLRHDNGEMCRPASLKDVEDTFDRLLSEREAQVREIVEDERVSFWGSPELEAQTKINNTVVDNILQALTDTSV